MTLLIALLLAAPPEVSSAYRIETPHVIKVKKGEPSVARVEVVPRSDAHVSPDAPISLTMHAGPAATLVKEKLGRAEAQATAAQGVAFDVPFTATQNEKLEGTLSFFICTEKLCERQKRDVKLAVEVQ